MQHLKDLGAIIFLAVFYFTGTFFALAALISAYYAMQVAFIVAMIAVGLFFVLVLARREEEGLPMALLFMFPFTCFLVGIVWWMLQLAGFWEAIR